MNEPTRGAIQGFAMRWTSVMGNCIATACEVHQCWDRAALLDLGCQRRSSPAHFACRRTQRQAGIDPRVIARRIETYSRTVRTSARASRAVLDAAPRSLAARVLIAPIACPSMLRAEKGEWGLGEQRVPGGI